ncbi:class I SAM-dependent methyltransferase [Abyssibius alkaniclasticus]|uniref:class I SAM-dependent methyltransferase n=1 Tax=Abyssibius alkaniclasticus TaxID=2881234 RepID=UPI0023635E61|nr:class I SAM-dependent methyltransferase [Abyssibius alkaniclasticus]UPH71258.1 class I SAM-dependent methyltransferase [Abyssibius alkaniclasticus]
MSSFTDAQAVANYASRPAQQVPGFHDLQRMAAILLAERAPDNAEILVLGAGGGLELRAFAQRHPNWRFTGVDPSAEMLALARQTLGPLAARATLVKGYIDTAPPGPFDGATCILTLHFVPRAERVNTLAELRRRLKSGAPLIIAHHSFPAGQAESWLNRYADFATPDGADPAKARAGAQAIAQKLPILSPEDEMAALTEAGFTEIAQFYQGFTFRGWVATAP